MDADTVLRHICETCGLEQELTSQEGFEEGWDYPPRLGPFGVLSPRTCGSCGIETTLYWRIITKQVDPNNLSEQDIALIERVNAEPESIIVR